MGKFHPEYQNKTSDRAATRNAPRTERRPSKALLNKALRSQLSSMSEGYSELPRLLPQRQRATFGRFRNLDDRGLSARVRLELLDVVF
jgi:hypothetical protein